MDEQDVNRKFDGIASEINSMQTKLISMPEIPSDAKKMYGRLIRLKEKIQNMRKEGLSKSGEFSVGNLAFKKLRNEGYIEKVINLISQSYERIYSE